jgi:WD40 repeat protein
VLASLAAVFAFRQQSRARDAAGEALRARDQAVNAAVTSASVQLAPTDPSLSAQLALTAYRMDPTPEAASRLVTTENTPLDTRLPGPPGAVYTVVHSPDGHMLAAGNVHPRLVRLWDVSDPSRPVALGRPVPVDRSVDSILSLAFSPDGRVLAVGGHTSHNGDAGSAGFVDLWSLTSPSHPVLLGRPKSPAIRGWDAAASIESLAFSPDGRTLAAGWHAGLVSLWDVTRPDDVKPVGAPRVLGCPDVFSHRIAFSPDGRTLAAGNQNTTVSLWNTVDPDNPAPRGAPLTGPEDPVNAVAFSPDGRTLAAGDSGGTVTLWDTADPNRPVRLRKSLTGANGSIFSLVFSPDGHTLAAAGDNELGSIALWDISDPAHPDAKPGISHSDTSSVASLAFSRDGTMLAAGGDGSNGSVGPWSTTDPGVRIGQRIDQPTATSTWVTFSPDGRTLATGNSRGTVTLWNATDPHHLTPRGSPLTVPGGSLWSVAFSPDGRTRGGRSHRQRHRQPVERHRSRPPRPHRPAVDRGDRIRLRPGVRPGRSHPGRHHRRRRGDAPGPERRVRHQPHLRRELRRVEPAAMEPIRRPTAVRPTLREHLRRVSSRDQRLDQGEGFDPGSLVDQPPITLSSPRPDPEKPLRGTPHGRRRT